MMKKTILMLLFLTTTLFMSEATAQEYGSAIGLRLGYPSSVSYKFFLNEASAVELVGGTRGFSGYRWFNVGASYQIHKELSAGDVEGLYYYYGFGASLYFWNFDNSFIDPGASTSIGLQGFLGLSYSFEDTPINITVDWVPTFFLNGFGNGFGADGGSVGIRYILGR